MKKYSQVPQELKSEVRWVLWKYRTRENGEVTKVPFQPGAYHKAKSNDPETWSTYDVAIESLENSNRYDGIGFMLGGGWVGIDVDKIYDKDQESKSIPDVLNPFKETAYMELSPSGTGIHAIFYSKPGASPKPPNIGKDSGGKKDGVEIYFKNRYFTITGNIVSTPEEDLHNYGDRNSPLLVESFKKIKPEWWEQAKLVSPQPDPSTTLDDQKVIEEARNSRNGSGSKFRALYDDGNISGFESPSMA